MVLSADDQYVLNHMNSVALKTALGDVLKALEAVPPGEIALASAHLLVGSAGGVAADVAVTGDVTLSNAGVTAIGALKVLTAMINTGAVTLAKLDAGVTPSHVVKFAGKIAMSGTTQDISVPGVVGGDICLVQINTADTSSRTIVTAVTATDKVTVVFSGAAGTGGSVSYVVWRAAA